MDESKVAIVTGAGSGIGKAVSVRLAGLGWCVALVGRSGAKLRGTANEIMQSAAIHTAHSPLILSIDIGRAPAAEAIVQRVLNHWGHIDALVNNAGVVEPQRLGEADDRTWQETFATNVFGPGYLVNQLWPVFIEQHGGCVVNVSSISTIDPHPGLGAYAASKAALESLTRSIDKEGREHGIRGFSVAPGNVETAMLRSVAAEETLSTDRTLSPDAVAQVIVECMSGQRDDAVGTTILLPSP